MRAALTTLTLICALWIAGCATERLDASAPKGVNLTGEWNFNANLSDDPDKPGDSDKTQQQGPRPHRGHGGGRGGGSGMPPLGGPGGGYDYLPVADTPPASTPGSAPSPVLPASGQGGSRMRAPQHLSITQKENTVTIRTNLSDGRQLVDEYTAGTSTTIPYGNETTAARSVGWRGPVFVVTTTVGKGTSREEEFALDEEDHLIVTTATKGGRRGDVEIKRVYDRVRGAQS
jgi:hypothetical protein